MPPKIKFSEQDIIEAAFSVAREKGLENLSFRMVAKELKSSTMPVYSFLKSEKNLVKEVIKKAFEFLFEYQTTSRTGDAFMDMGIGYVLFAKNEKQLFRAINHESYIEIQKTYFEDNLSRLADILEAYPEIKGTSKKDIKMFLQQGFIYSHGLATLVNNSFYKDMDEAQITELLVFTASRYTEGFVGKR
jgi:AcrR family transcriptional regulator